MNDNATIQEIRSAVGRLQRRVSLARMIESTVTGACWGVLLGMIGLALFKTGWIPLASVLIVFGLAVLVPAVAGAVAFFRKTNDIELAQRLDRAHGLHDRLSTALSIARLGTLDEFQEAQIRDAARYVDTVEVSRAAPFSRPTDMIPLALLGFAFAGIWVLRPPSHIHPLPPAFEVRHEAVLDDATVALERSRIEAIKNQLAESEDEEAKELVEEIENLLDKVENREISEKDFLKELDRLEKNFMEKQGKDGVEKMADRLKAAAEELEKSAKKELKKEPEAQKMLDALKKKDLAGAAEALEELAKKIEKNEMSAKDLERLASLLEKFADAIDLDDPELQKLLEENKELVEKLQKLFDQKKLSDPEKNRLNKEKERGKDLERKKNQEKQSKYQRSLKQLKRKTKEMSEKAKKAAADQKKSGKKGKKQEQQGKFKQEAGRDMKEMSRQLKQQGQEQKQSEAKKAAQKQLEELREAMQRSKRGEPQEGEEQGQRKEQMEDFIDRAKGQQPQEGSGGEQGEAGGPDDKKGKKMKGNSPEDGKGSGKGEEGQKTDSAGTGKGERELGEETKLEGKRQDQKLSGDAGKGASRSEIIKSASEEGFATTDYKDVYVDYESVVEEVMDKEKVPAGYRFYIKRYFQLIKPQE